MNYGSVIAALVLILCTTGPARAEVAAGRWAISGKVDGKDLKAECSFAQDGARLSGSCTDDRTGSHPLTHGQVTGDETSWSYEMRFLLIRFEVRYAGARKGDTMSGTITAAGRNGTFTARRIGP